MIAYIPKSSSRKYETVELHDQRRAQIVLGRDEYIIGGVGRMSVALLSLNGEGIDGGSVIFFANNPETQELEPGIVVVEEQTWINGPRMTDRKIPMGFVSSFNLI